MWNKPEIIKLEETKKMLMYDHLHAIAGMDALSDMEPVIIDIIRHPNPPDPGEIITCRCEQ